MNIVNELGAYVKILIILMVQFSTHTSMNEKFMITANLRYVFEFISVKLLDYYSLIIDEKKKSFNTFEMHFTVFNFQDTPFCFFLVNVKIVSSSLSKILFARLKIIKLSFTQLLISKFIIGSDEIGVFPVSA